MAITPKCDMCQLELHVFGAILLSPPDNTNKVTKFHVCVDCYQKLLKQMQTEQS